MRAEKLLIAGMLLVVVGAISAAAPATLGQDAARLVRVQVDGTWYDCEAQPDPTLHPIFATATWQPPPTPTPEVLDAEITIGNSDIRYQTRQGMNLRAWPGVSAPIVGGLG